MRSLRRAALPPLQVASHLLLVRAHEASVSSHVLAQLLQCGAVGCGESVGDDSGQTLQGRDARHASHVKRRTSHVIRHTSHVTHLHGGAIQCRGLGGGPGVEEEGGVGVCCSRLLLQQRVNDHRTAPFMRLGGECVKRILLRLLPPLLQLPAHALCQCLRVGGAALDQREGSRREAIGTQPLALHPRSPGARDVGESSCNCSWLAPLLHAAAAPEHATQGGDVGQEVEGGGSRGCVVAGGLGGEVWGLGRTSRVTRHASPAA